MNTSKLDTLIDYFQSILEGLYELKSQESTYNDEISATTATVYLKTGVLYKWHKLNRWCKTHGHTPKQIENTV